jgi:hypothetical protein
VLKVSDIDSGRMVMRQYGNGGKERYGMLSALLLGGSRVRRCIHSRGRTLDKPIEPKVLRAASRSAATAARLGKRVSVHVPRHTSPPMFWRTGAEGDQATPKIAPAVEAFRLTDGCNESRCDDRADAGIVVSWRAFSFSFSPRTNSASKAGIRRSSSAHCARASPTGRIMRELNLHHALRLWTPTRSSC